MRLAMAIMSKYIYECPEIISDLVWLIQRFQLSRSILWQAEVLCGGAGTAVLSQINLWYNTHSVE